MDGRPRRGSAEERPEERRPGGLAHGPRSAGRLHSDLQPRPRGAECAMIHRRSAGGLGEERAMTFHDLLDRTSLLISGIGIAALVSAAGATTVVIDTDQHQCYDDQVAIPCPDPGDPFFGQDAQHEGTQPAFQDNGDGTVTDLRTGLMWQQSFIEDISWDDATSGAETFELAGYTDWRLPTIKELYSLIQFDGVCGTDSLSSIPFIDRDYFEFAYGTTRFIDHQEWSSNTYVGAVFDGQEAAFGVNFADGRIKGYPKSMHGSPNLMEARYVRDGADYGVNDFHDNGDGTITDHATGLMWTQGDSESAMNWEDALAWVQARNDESHLGHDDWRLPDAKELQGILDYTRAPDATGTAAIDPAFRCTEITNEGGDPDYPWYWTGTTHLDGPPDIQPAKAAYVCFGRALGWMEVPPGSNNWVLMDVHGAGAQRSDLKSGDPDDWPHGHGPQGDVVRIFNFVRLVRDAEESTGLLDPGSAPAGRLTLRAAPNPSFGATRIHFGSIAEGPATLEILDVAGRSVKTLSVGRSSSGAGSLVWDGTDVRGRRAAPGVYFARLRTGGGSGAIPVLIVR
ncbi:MAG: DUF1566 domain-containing protein [Candidatus Latescibacteria bacterium]|nr:DUF1566 domain-containing protein [Candidatus Latescibacterota bacterium]